MGIGLIIRICKQAATFDQLYANYGNSYLCLQWAEDGYELYIRKSEKACEEKLADKAVIAKLLGKRRLSQLAAIIEGALCIDGDIFEQLPDLVQKKRYIIFQKDGSIIVEA